MNILLVGFLTCLSLGGWCNCFSLGVNIIILKQAFFHSDLNFSLLTALNVTGTTCSGTAPFPITPCSWQAGCSCKAVVRCLSRIVSQPGRQQASHRNPEEAHKTFRFQKLAHRERKCSNVACIILSDALCHCLVWTVTQSFLHIKRGIGELNSFLRTCALDGQIDISILTLVVLNTCNLTSDWVTYLWTALTYFCRGRILSHFSIPALYSPPHLGLGRGGV